MFVLNTILRSKRTHYCVRKECSAFSSKRRRMHQGVNTNAVNAGFVHFEHTCVFSFVFNCSNPIAFVMRLHRFSHGQSQFCSFATANFGSNQQPQQRQPLQQQQQQPLSRGIHYHELLLQKIPVPPQWRELENLVGKVEGKGNARGAEGCMTRILMVNCNYWFVRTEPAQKFLLTLNC